MTTEANQDGELTGREMDAAMAQLMGWKRVHSDRDEGVDRKNVAWMLHHESGVLKGKPYTHPSMGGLYDRAFAKWSPSSKAEIHDPDRADLDHPAPTLDVNRAVRSATYNVPK